MAASYSASAAANMAAIGTWPYLMAQFDELAEMPISISRMGSGVCTHSRGRAPLVKRHFVLKNNFNKKIGLSYRKFIIEQSGPVVF